MMGQKEKKNLRILLVDDEAELRKSIVRTLKMEDYEVVEAGNGQEAKEILGQEKFDLVISDVKMPIMHGIALLHHVKKTQANLPFIMITGFSEVMEATEAYEIGAAGFLTKPFNPDDILNEISRVLTASEDFNGFKFEFSKEKKEKEYCPVPLKEFASGVSLKFPIFLKLGENKFIKIANKGEDLSLERISKLEEKGVYYFFLLKNHFKEYVEFFTYMTQEKVLSKITPSHERLELLQTSGNLLLTCAFGVGLDSFLYDATLTNLKQALSLITEEKDIYDILNSFKESSESLYSHSMSSCLISLLLAREIKIESSLNIYKISIVSFFHDIGLSHLPTRLIKKTPFLFSKEDLELYHSHPRLGAEILSQIPDIQLGLEEILLQHHENWDGSGFPNGIMKEKIHPLARILRVADEFGYWMIGSPGYEKVLSPKQAIINLEKDSHKFDPKILKALRNIYKK